MQYNFIEKIIARELLGQTTSMDDLFKRQKVDINLRILKKKKKNC